MTKNKKITFQDCVEALASAQFEIETIKNNFQVEKKKTFTKCYYQIQEETILQVKKSIEDSEKKIEDLQAVLLFLEKDTKNIRDNLVKNNQNLIEQVQSMKEDYEKIVDENQKLKNQLRDGRQILTTIEKNFQLIEKENSRLKKDLDLLKRKQNAESIIRESFLIHSKEDETETSNPLMNFQNTRNTIEEPNEDFSTVDEFSFEDHAADKLKKKTESNSKNMNIHLANKIGMPSKDTAELNNDELSLIKKINEIMDAVDSTSNVKEVNRFAIPEWETTYFISMTPNGFNIFKNSIYELMIMNSKGSILFHEKFIKKDKGIEVYTFDEYRNVIQKVLSQCTRLVGYYLSDTIQYLFGNRISCDSQVCIDLATMFQKIENNDIMNDVVTCAKHFNPTVDIGDRTEFNKTSSTLFVYEQLFARCQDVQVFTQCGRLPEFQALIKSWDLEKRYNIKWTKKEA